MTPPTDFTPGARAAYEARFKYGKPWRKLSDAARETERCAFAAGLAAMPDRSAELLDVANKLAFFVDMIATDGDPAREYLQYAETVIANARREPEGEP